MSKESMDWLNNNILVGFTEKRGTAWWADGSDNSNANHFVGAVPMGRVEELFGWEAVSRPVYVGREIIGGERDGDWEPVKMADRQAVVHPTTGDVFGIFKDGYVIHQYDEWLVKNVFTMLHGEALIGSAGLLQGGGVAWVSIELPENMSTPQGVSFRPNLLSATSLNGTMSTTYKRVITNVVCDNTLAAGLSEEGQVLKIKHTRNSKLRIGEARNTLDLLYEAADNFMAEVEALTNTSVSSAQWEAFLEAHDPIKDKEKAAKTRTEGRHEALRQLYISDPRVAPWSGTAFGVLQAVNTYEHWEGVTKGGKSRAERNMLGMVKGTYSDLDAKTVRTLDRVLASA